MLYFYKILHFVIIINLYEFYIVILLIYSNITTIKYILTFYRYIRFSGV